MSDSSRNSKVVRNFEELRQSISNINQVNEQRNSLKNDDVMISKESFMEHNNHEPHRHPDVVIG